MGEAGELPNPNECNSTLTSGTSGAEPPLCHFSILRYLSRIQNIALSKNNRTMSIFVIFS